jgi:hypothetical protein
MGPKHPFSVKISPIQRCFAAFLAGVNGMKCGAMIWPHVVKKIYHEFTTIGRMINEP